MCLFCYISFQLSNSTCSPNGRATIDIITPEDSEERGAQLSLKFSSSIDNIFKELMKRGVCVSVLGMDSILVTL